MGTSSCILPKNNVHDIASRSSLCVPTKIIFHYYEQVKAVYWFIMSNCGKRVHQSLSIEILDEFDRLAH